MGADCPSLSPDQSQIQAELTASGIQKIAVWGATASVNTLKSQATSFVIPNVTVSPNPQDCTPQKFATYSNNDMWGKCYGLPKGWVDGPTTKLNQWVVPVPSAFSFANAKVNELSLGDAIVDSCSVNGCRVRIPLNKLSMVTDVSVASLGSHSGSPKPSFSVKGLAASLSANSDGPIYITASVKLDSKNGLGQLVTLDPSSVQFSLPPGSLKMDLSHSDADDAQMKQVMAQNLYHSLQKKFQLPLTSDPTEINAIISNLPAKVVGTESFRDAMANAYIDGITPRFNNRDSAELFQSGQWIVSNLTQNQGFIKVLNQVIATSVIPRVTTAVNQQLKTVPLLSSSIQETLPLARPQNTIDLSLVSLKANLQKANLANVQSSLQKGADLAGQSRAVGQEFERARNMAFTLNDISDSKGVASTLNPLLSSWQDLKNQVDQMMMQNGHSSQDIQLLKKMDDQCVATIAFLNSELDHFAKLVQPGEDFLLRMTSAQVDQISQSIRAGISLCTSCSGQQIMASGAPKPSDFKVAKNYDAAVRVNLATINAYLATMYNKDSWDMCLAGTKANDSDCDKFHFFGGPPTLSWNGHGLSFNIPKISVNETVTACGPVDLELGTSSDQKNITLVPTNMHMKFCLNNTSVWKSVLSMIEAATLVVPMGEDAALNLFKSRIIGAMKTPEIPVPPQIKVKSVATDPSGITVYGDVNTTSLPTHLSALAANTSTKP